LNTRALAILAALGCVWGASFLFIKVIVEETSPLTLVAMRLTLGALPLLLLIVYKRPRIIHPKWVLPRTLVTAVFATALPFFLISTGEQHIDSGVAAVLNSTMPLWTAVFTALFLPHERLGRSSLVGLAVGFGGVLVLSSPDLAHLTDSSFLGELAVMLAAVSYGGALVFARATLSKEDPILVATLQLSLGALVMWPLAFAFSGGSPNLDVGLKPWLSWITLGCLGTGIAYVAYYWLMTNIGVLVSAVTYIPPVIGLFLGWLVLDEKLGINVIAGAALIILGVAVLTGRLTFAQRWLPGRTAAQASSPD
jgi:drug/metabolite transporter (DMT)-like permease